MTILVEFPSTGAFSLQDFAGIINFMAIDADIGSFSSGQFSGFGTYNGTFSTFTAIGSGFVPGQLGGEDYVIAGTVDVISFSSGGNSLQMTNVAIDLSVFAPIIYADDIGANPTAIEDFLLGLAWNFQLGDGDDVAPSGSFVGDNVPFNLRGNDILDGHGGNDLLFGGGGSDTLRGGAGQDILEGGTGRDRLFGESGLDLLIGESGNDRLLGGGGNDTLQGDAGRDRLLGGGGRDELNGGSGGDRLLGGGGRDVLNGDRGNDILSGNRGDDLFIFNSRSGHDTITDFNATDNGERIDLSDVRGIRNFRDLSNNHVLQDGNDVVISAGSHNSITLLNVDLADLGSGDFIF